MYLGDLFQVCGLSDHSRAAEADCGDGAGPALLHQHEGDEGQLSPQVESIQYTRKFFNELFLRPLNKCCMFLIRTNKVSNKV